jgi:hypothetical protein
MTDIRKGYVTWSGSDYRVSWHTISKEVYVYWGTDRYAGKSSSMEGALDIALSWLNRQAR